LVAATVQPGGFVAAAHVHPNQHERFEVLEGTLCLRLGRQTVTAHAGQTVTVPAGTAHRFRNPGDGEPRFLCEVRPALAFEQLLETMFALAEDDRTNRKGMPNPLRLAVIAKAHFDVVRLPFPPVALQRLGLVADAAVGRALGYEATYLGEAVAQPVVSLGECDLAAI
jgi:hypothetical protein